MGSEPQQVPRLTEGMTTPGAISTVLPVGLGPPPEGVGAAQGGMVQGALGPAAQSQRQLPLQQCCPLGQPLFGVPNAHCCLAVAFAAAAAWRRARVARARAMVCCAIGG